MYKKVKSIGDLQKFANVFHFNDSFCSCLLFMSFWKSDTMLLIVSILIDKDC